LYAAKDHHWIWDRFP